MSALDNANPEARIAFEEQLASAMEACNFREHVMKQDWLTVSEEGMKIRAQYTCIECPAYVQVCNKPQSNESEVGGSAVALDCPIAPNECPVCGTGVSYHEVHSWRYRSSTGKCECENCGYVQGQSMKEFHLTIAYKLSEFVEQRLRYHGRGDENVLKLNIRELSNETLVKLSGIEEHGTVDYAVPRLVHTQVRETLSDSGVDLRKYPFRAIWFYPSDPENPNHATGQLVLVRDLFPLIVERAAEEGKVCIFYHA